MIIGIDPGMSGAIAVRSQGWIWIYDIPTKKDNVISGNNKKVKNDYDFYKLNQIIRSIISHWDGKEEIMIVCEYSGGMSFGKTKFREARRDDSKTAWKIGYGFGVIRAIFGIHALCFNHTPRPGDWKRKLGLADSGLTYPQKKEKSRLKALELFPELEKHLKRKKDSDRAEALLLTVWAEMKGAKK